MHLDRTTAVLAGLAVALMIAVSAASGTWGSAAGGPPVHPIDLGRGDPALPMPPAEPPEDEEDGPIIRVIGNLRYGTIEDYADGDQTR
jgi:hypothetical protein